MKSRKLKRSLQVLVIGMVKRVGRKKRLRERRRQVTETMKSK
jgi:hypothetical protein